MLLWLGAVALGLVVLVWSAERFVAGAAATSRHLGLPPLVIGMLVLGFGTSAPELAVSALAAGQGNPGLALGNAYGSNIANIGLILGLVALISPLAVHSRVLRRELPILGAITLLALWQLRDGVVGYGDAWLLLGLLAVFIGYSLWQGRQADSLGDETEELLNEAPMALPKALTWTLVGLVLLVASSRLLVWGAVEIAESLGVSDLVIGLTIVAVGTSLPELAASVSALRRREHDLVLGNVVGSNLFNTLGVVGLAGAIAPIDAGAEVIMRDWPVMAAMTLLMAIFAIGWRGRDGRINRVEGATLLAIYVAYLGYLAWLLGAA